MSDMSLPDGRAVNACFQAVPERDERLTTALSFLDHIGLGLLKVGIDGRILSMNTAAADVLRLPPPADSNAGTDNFWGQCFKDIQDAAVLHSSLLRNGYLPASPAKLVDRSGSSFNVSLMATRSLDHPESLYDLVLAPEDQDCDDTKSDACPFRLSPDGALIEASRSFANLLGYKTADACHADLRAGPLGKFWCQSDDVDRTVRGHDEVVGVETQLWKNGREARARVLINSKAIYDAAGEIIHFDCRATNIDIDRRVSVELQRKRLMVDQTGEALFLTTPEAQILDCNLAAAKLFGVERSDIIGRYISDFFAQDPEEAAAVREKTLAMVWGSPDQDYFRVERLMRAANQTTMPIEATLTRFFSPTGEPEGLVSSFRDISAWKAAQAELEEHRTNLEALVDEKTRELSAATEEAHTANRLKSEFLASMSHEIRTPLNGIIGNAELILDGNLDQREQGYSTTILSSAEALLDLINNIVDLSKVESGRFELETRVFDFSQMVDDVAQLLAPKAREKSIDLLVRYAPGTPRSVTGDAGRFRQILINLVGNAIKFTDQGHVMISVERKGHGASDDLIDFEIAVEDTGIGIPADKQVLIFDRFAQADGSTTREYGGTGLGLPISKELVKLMGGNLQIKSEPGQGATFWFNVSLPRAENACADSLDLLNGARTLSICGSDAEQSNLSEQLTEIGAASGLIRNIDEAFDRINDAHLGGSGFNFVLLDQSAIEQGWPEVRERLKGDARIADPVTVLLCTDSVDDEEEQLKSLGVDSWLQKPIRMSQLLDTMADLLKARTEGRAMGRTRQIASGTSTAQYQAESAISGLRVLLVEDNRVNRELAKEHLSKLHCSVVTAEHGKESIALAMENTVDIILMDCQMPVMDGFDATKALKGMMANGEIAPTPIVALTANAMDGDRERCLKAGMDDYATKPIRKAMLIDLLTRWCVDCEGEDEGLSMTDQGVGKTEVGAASGPDDDVPVGGQPMPIEIAGTEMTIDLEVINDTRDVLGDQFATVIGFYLEDAAKYVHDVETGAACGDAQCVVAGAHPLKSSSRELGVMELSSAAKQIEEAARSGDMAGIDPLIRSLRPALERARQQFELL